MSVDHGSRKHALLSASGAERWLNCTPSARLETKFKESSSSVFAQEGTLAHEFGDLELRLLNKEIDKKTYSREVGKLRKHKLYTDEMEGEVQKYVDFVKESLNVAKHATSGSVLLVEERLDFSHLVEGGFGTGDATIISDTLLEVIDLKYGKGVVVHAEGNPQLMLYAAGALRAFELSYDIQTVRMTIVQPRLNHISTFDISVEDLIKWGEEQVKPKAAQAYEGKGEQKAGSWCKWCKVKAMCRTLADHNTELVKHDFKDPQLLTEEELLGIYEQQPMLVDWANSVAKHLLETAKEGKSWPGYKLVAGRSNRKWVNEQRVAEKLIDNNYDVDTFQPRKLAGIGAIEKLVGKADFGKMLGDLVVKPEGAPTLAPENDKRPALGFEQAREDFAKKL